MTVKLIDNVTDIKGGQYGVSSKIHSGSDAFFVNEDASYMKGKTVQFDAEEKTAKSGAKYKVARNVKIIEDAPPVPVAANGTLHWPDYETIIRRAHRLIMELEPDVYGPTVELEPDVDGPTVPSTDEVLIAPVTVDRSRARVAFLSTIVIAASNGKIAVDAEQDVPF